MHSGLERFSQHTIAMFVGLIGAVLALAVNVLCNLLNVLPSIPSFAHDSGHFLLGLFLALIGAVGALLAPVVPAVPTVMLLLAGVAFVFAVGWWALFVSPFFLAAGLMAYGNWPRRLR